MFPHKVTILRALKSINVTLIISLTFPSVYEINDVHIENISPCLLSEKYIPKIQNL